MGDAAVQTEPKIRRVQLADLLRGDKKLIIVHEGKEYVLCPTVNRMTGRHGLILTRRDAT